jgi:hypothetical protein
MACMLQAAAVWHMCPHTTKSLRYLCVLILRKASLLLLQAAAVWYVGAHTTIYVSSYYYICVLILPHIYSSMSTHILHMCPHCSYYYICVATNYCTAICVYMVYMCPTALCRIYSTTVLYMCAHNQQRPQVRSKSSYI